MVAARQRQVKDAGALHFLRSKLMVGKAITRVDLGEAVRQKLNFSRAESAELVGQVLGEVCDCLATGEDVKLTGFGLFAVRNKGERMGRNPKTGVEVPIDKRRVLTFRPSTVLKAHVNGESAADED
jgi:integration host factor subunit alpha